MRFLSKMMALILTTVCLLSSGFIYAQDSVQGILVRSENVDSPFLAQDDAAGKRIQQTVEAYLYAYEIAYFQKQSIMTSKSGLLPYCKYVFLCSRFK